MLCVTGGCLLFPFHIVVFVQSLSYVQLFATPWTSGRQVSLSFTVSRSLLKLMSTESVMPSNHLILCRPLLLLPSILPSIRIISNELALHIRWPKYWSFSFSSSPSNEYSGLISFRIDWFDLLEVQGSPRVQESSPAPQFKSVNASVLSLLYGPTLTSVHDYWKSHNFDSMDLCWFLNTLYTFVIAFILRSKCLLISWLQSLSIVILEPKKIKLVTVSIFPHLLTMK